MAGWFMLDLGLYLQHVLIHSAPTLWRIHKVHHSDLDFDVSTSVRIHPFELFLWRLFRFGAIAVSGASPAAVLFFEVMLNAQEMFIHANVNIPEEIDRKLRWAIVTPDMHRIHHSVAIAEANSNFGFHTVL